MNRVHTRYARLCELPLDAAAATHWLSAAERVAHARMRAAERRDTWLAGRITCKRLLLEVLTASESPLADLPASALHIESRSTNPGHGERPALFVDNVPRPMAISIAHSSRGVLVAMSLHEQINLGVDLVEPLAGTSGLGWTFTARERAWLAGDRRAAARLWALKESLYKASQTGEGFSPQKIDVTPGRAPVYPERNLASDLRTWQTWRVDGQIAALAIVAAVKADYSRHQHTHSHAALAHAA